MVGLTKSRFNGLALAAFATVTLGTMSKDATASEIWVPVNAPITYKMADPSDMTGFHALPQQQYIPPMSTAPQASLPVPVTPLPHVNPARPQVLQMPTPSTPVPMANQTTVPVFDASRVDQNLYPHQRIGKTYTVAGKSYTPKHQPRYDMVGTASWYGDKFHGKLTANGEKYDKNGMTAAHKTLPLNSLVVVTNLQTGASVTLRVNDRGPFIGERIIDLSEAAAGIMGIKTTGLGNVRVQYAGPALPNSIETPVQFGSKVAAPQTHASRPALPSLVPVAPPKPQVQGPAPMPQGYQPLRNMGAAPEAASPKTAQLQPPQVHIPDVMNPVSIVPKAALPSMPHSIPEAYIPPQQPGGADDTVVTMTISGPIHMARHQVQPGQIYYVPTTQLPIK